MELKVSQETVAILNFLLPGFVAAAVFYLFTPHRRTTEASERTIEAFILTGVVQFFVSLIKSLALWIGHLVVICNWTENTSLGVGLSLALLVGFGLAYCSNNDLPHKWLRALPENKKRKRFLRWLGKRLKGKCLTKETTFPTEWCNAFNASDDRFVMLHLKNGLRMYAQLDEWPNYPDKGHFVVLAPEWLDRDNGSTLLDGVHKMLIPVEEVGIVEFMKNANEMKRRKDQVKKKGELTENSKRLNQRRCRQRKSHHRKLKTLKQTRKSRSRRKQNMAKRGAGKVTNKKKKVKPAASPAPPRTGKK